MSNVDARTIARSSAIVAAGTALSRITGFARVAAVAYALGVTTVAGVYSYANETPNIVYELLLGGVLTATLVPFFVRQLEATDDRGTSAVFTTALVALTVATLLGILLAPWIVDLYTLRVRGADRADQQQLATTFLRLFMPQIFFYGVTALATGVLNARRRYAAAAFAPVLNNVVVVVVFLTLARVASDPISVQSMLDDSSLVLLVGLGTTAGVAVMALALVPAMRAAGIALRFVFDVRDRAVVRLLRLSGWSIGYVVANQIALWVVLVLANGIDGGAFAYLSAYAFFQLPHGLFSVSIMTTLTPEMSSAAARDDIDALRDRLSLGLRLVAVVVLPACAVLIGLARPIIVALLQRGAFDAADTTVVAHTLALFAVGILPFSLYLLTLRVFYAQHDTRTPFVVNCVENASNIALAFPLFAWLEIPGLALAFSGAYVVGVVIAAGVARARLFRIDGRRVASVAARSTIVALGIGAVTWLTGRIVGYGRPTTALVTLVVGTALAGTVFVLGAWILRIREVTSLRSIVVRTPTSEIV